MPQRKFLSCFAYKISTIPNIYRKRNHFFSVEEIKKKSVNMSLLKTTRCHEGREEENKMENTFH